MSEIFLVTTTQLFTRPVTAIKPSIEGSGLPAISDLPCISPHLDAIGIQIISYIFLRIIFNLINHL